MGNPANPGKPTAMDYAALGSILLLGAAVRLWGIRWGLPDETHLFSYHPDEFHSLRGALSLATGDPNPHFFNYGSLYLYLVAIACNWHAAVVGGADLLTALLKGNTAHTEMAAWVLDARLVVVLCALATVYVTWLAGRQLGGNRGGLIAAGLMSVMPLHALNSHYATVDVPQSLFILLCLHFAVRLVTRITLRDCIWAGVAAGLAASVKYNGALVFVAPVLAVLVSPRDAEADAPPVWESIAAMLAAALGAFALTSPYVFLAWPEACEHIRYEIEHMRVGESPWQEMYPNGWLFHLHVTVFLAALALLLCRGRTRAAVAPAAAFALLWFLMIGAAGVRYARYEMPLEVCAPVLAAGLASWFAKHRTVVSVALVAAFALSLFLSINRCLVLSAPDPRDRMLEIINTQVPEHETLALIWEPWFNVAPVDYCNGGAALRSNPLFARFKRPVRKLLIVGLDAGKLEEARPFAVLTSDFDLPARAARVSKGHEAIQRALAARKLTEIGPQPMGLIEIPPARDKSDMHYADPTQQLWVLRHRPASSGDE
ncbi:MAG: glycosyltransferase family 39 protein [Armatimonadetes bacterium]|nr:glycosyltransferase family 39 protein [Armatimonadota bacterium]